MRALFAVLLAAVSLHLGAATAEASCRQQTLAEQAERAEVVAFGRVNGSTFQVREVLKGQVPQTIQVRFGAGPPGVLTSVDYMPANGTDHTLYLRTEAGAYLTDACSGSHRGAPTTGEREYFTGGGTITSTGSDFGVGFAVDPLPAALIAAGLTTLALAAVRLVRRRRQRPA